MQQGAVPKALSTLSSLSPLSNRCPTQSVGPGIQPIKSTAVWSHVRNCPLRELQKGSQHFGKVQLHWSHWSLVDTFLTLPSCIAKNSVMLTSMTLPHSAERLHAPPACYTINQHTTRCVEARRAWYENMSVEAILHTPPCSRVGALGVRSLELFDGKLPPTGVMCMISGLTTQSSCCFHVNFSVTSKNTKKYITK